MAAETYYDFLVNEFLTNGRELLFDKFISHFRLSVSLQELLDLLHNQQADIHLDIQVYDLLDLLKQMKKKVYILTNGHVGQQRNKINLLGVLESFPNIEVIYASMYEPKPSPVSLHHIMSKENVGGDEIIMIGDSKTDKAAAINAQTDFMYIQYLNK